MHRRTILICAASALLTGGLGFACGAAVTPRDPLPAAGTADDDGSGVLARASHEDTLFGLLAPTDPGPRARARRSKPNGEDKAGTTYGNYSFDWGMSNWRGNPTRSYQPGYFGSSARTTITLRGTVTWPRPPAAPATLPTEDPACGPQIANDTLRVDAARRVAGAVVFLDQIYLGREGVLDSETYNSTLQIGGQLQLQECRFLPHVQIVAPMGALLRLSHDDQAAREWTATLGAEEVFQMTVAGAMPRRVAMTKAGIIGVADKRIPSTAWVVVARHPYYTVTDERGRFRFDQVPPGKYMLRVWHEPVAQLDPQGRVVFTQPVEHRQPIRVGTGKHKPISIQLPTRTSRRSRGR